MNAAKQWGLAFNECPLIAILRGLTPTDAIDVSQALYEAGVRIVEVPLNSPDPFESIKLIAEKFSDKMLVGAGTVLNAEEAQLAVDAGGQLLVAPNLNSEVAKIAKVTDSIYCPGVATPTEAFMALDLGATALKLFPGDLITPSVVNAIRAVLPKTAVLVPVGGVNMQNMQQYWDAGANGFGIGSAIYKISQPADSVEQKATEFVATMNTIKTASAG